MDSFIDLLIVVNININHGMNNFNSFIGYKIIVVNTYYSSIWYFGVSTLDFRRVSLIIVIVILDA